MNNPLNSVQNLYQKGLSLWQQKKANEAFQCFQNVLMQTDDKPFYLLAISELLLDTGYFQQGIAVLEQFSIETQKCSALQVRLASLHISMKASNIAIPILKDCIKKDPMHTDAYTRLAEIYGNQNNIKLAVDILSSLMKQYPDDLDIHNSAGSYLAAIGAEKDALKAYELYLQIGKYSATMLSKLANLNHSLGNFDKAIEFNLLAISKNPNSAAAYLGIATSKKFSSDDAIIIKQFNDAINLNLNAETLSSLYFALGKINDDLKNHTLAFDYFNKANAMRKQMINPTFEINAVNQQFTAIKKYFTKKQIAQLQKQSKNTIKPIFIVGMPRSGTTLLEQIFSSNKHVFCAGEIETLDFLPEHIENSTQNKVAYPEVLSHLPAAAMKYYQQQYLNSTTTEFNNFRHVLDKNPLNFINIGLIKVLFPQAHIIHCQRNPLDVCLSLYFQNFAHNKLNFSYNLNHIAKYYLAYLEIMKHWQAEDINILNINYEDLVSDTEHSINRLKQFTGLETLTFESKNIVSGAIHTASVWQARQNIHKGSIERWKNYRQQLLELIERFPTLFKIKPII